MKYKVQRKCFCRNIGVQRFLPSNLVRTESTETEHGDSCRTPRHENRSMRAERHGGKTQVVFVLSGSSALLLFCLEGTFVARARCRENKV